MIWFEQERAMWQRERVVSSKRRERERERESFISLCRKAEAEAGQQRSFSLKRVDKH